MTDIQKTLKDLVAIVVAKEEYVDETVVDAKVEELRHLPMFAVLTENDVEEVKAVIKSEFSIKMDMGVLIEEKSHEKWFLARKADLDMRYWERYRKYLLSDKGFSTRVVNTMDDVLDTLTDLLGDPTRNVSYKRRGLIIGDVQSGKTANYTGLICKAVDSGYKVVVLMTGTIEKLRQQTQSRIDEGFVGRDSDALIKQQEDKIVIGVGKYDPSISPVCLTSTSDDFKQKNAQNLNFDLRNINGSVIFVVKKNSSVLKRLNKWLRSFNTSGDKPIDNSILVIDDEADNASVNTKNDDSPTAINALIRELLKNFTKSSYVGFTATPYANIFIDPDSFNEMAEEDLFPKDYIYSLNAPSNYTGARDIFAEDGLARDMLVEINDDIMDPTSIASILPLVHKADDRVRDLPEDLKTAISAFVVANALEDLRGMHCNHRSMLVNVSRFTSVQEQVADLINDYLKGIQSACRLYCGMDPSVALKDEYISGLEKAYTEIYSSCDVSWEVLQPQLFASGAGIVVQTVNQRNGKNLSFDAYKDGLRLIAVGGMSLSRGLTLEGLVISYFYRNSKMYDTLMQMGRWFGYRGAYKDLCRIWMSFESIEWYRYISEATDELRDEVKRYQDSDLTPKDFGLRVRSDITSLLVTARNKMKSTESRECVVSLSGEVLETPEILADKSVNAANKAAVQKLLDGMAERQCPRMDPSLSGARLAFADVPSDLISGLLGSLEISPRNERFNTTSIINFISNYKGTELKKWDVAFASGSSDSVFEEFGAEYRIKPSVRQFAVMNSGKILKMNGSKRRLGTSGDGTIGISREDAAKVRELTGKENPAVKEYFRRIRRPPLLVIYIVQLGELIGDKTDEALRTAEDCRSDYYVGFEMGIPILENQETKYARYVLNKVAIQNMFEGETDDWEEEEFED